MAHVCVRSNMRPRSCVSSYDGVEFERYAGTAAGRDRGRAMSKGATVVKVALSLSDMDRHHYANYALTLAQHPSETPGRVMIRILAYALFADEGLAFGRGLSAQDEPDLAQTDLTGGILRWIDVGHPDEAALRRACGRAREVIVVVYQGRTSETWWDKQAPVLSKLSNLKVMSVPGTQSTALAALAARQMNLQCLIQDGQVQILSETNAVTLDVVSLKESIRDTASGSR